ncbi:transporter [Sinomonas flava]|uniref:Transporter n=1 Tax=Sinomonas flava TaxID=496857 RepID=A0ABN3BN27_9MICC
MVAHLIRLKLALLRNGLRRSPLQLIGLILGALYGLGAVALGIAGLGVLRLAEVPVAETLVVLGGSALVLGWALAPILVAGVDLTLDPARFALFPIPRRQLLLGQGLAGLIGVPGLCTVLLLAATALTWARGWAPLVTALVCAVVALGLCVAVSRLAAALASELAASRRFRDVSSVLLLIPLVLLGPIIALAAQSLDAVGASGLVAAGEVLGWTPLGAAFSAPAAAAQGNGLEALAKIGVAAAALALAAWGWSAALARALLHPAGAGRRRAGKRHRGAGLFGLLPATPAGAVAARCLVYWLRDPRYGSGLVVVPLLPVVLYMASAGGGGDPLAGPFAVSGPIVGFVLAWSISADVSYDSTAFALHLAAGVRGRDDRLGRALALLAFGLPVTLVATAVPCVVAGQWEAFPALLGLALGSLLSGVGLSSVVSARYTVAVPLPGESPFKKPSGNVAQTMLVQTGGLLVLGALISPEIALALLWAGTGQAHWGWLGLAAGAVLGPALAAGGVVLGGRWLDARGPETFASLTRAR